MPVRYHLLSLLSILATGLVDCHATPLTRRWDVKTVKHSWNTVPESWGSLGRPPADTAIDLYLALKPQHENALIDALHEVADLVAPHSDTLDLVNSWLEDHDIPPSSVSMTLGGNWLVATGVPVAQANDILGASYQVYQHVETNDTILRTISYSLPEALHGHIQTVAPTTHFGYPRTQRQEPRIHPRVVAAVRAKAGSEEPVTALQSRAPQLEPVTPAYVRWLYKTMGYEPAAVDQNTIGTAGYLEEYPSPQDLKVFMEEFRTDGEDATFDVVQINGGWNDPSNPGLEANLNLQFAEAITYPTPNIYYSTGNGVDTYADPDVEWLRYVLGQTSIPQTISTTYGADEYRIPQDYAKALCKLYAQLGARGVSLLFSTGDWGVGDGDCLLRDSSGDASLRFFPQFPASCPWVTSVGGTTSDSPEVAASLSGGGFSNYFPRPSYQANAVPPFLRNIGDLHQGLFDPNGRGLPDIAAQALHFVMVLKGKFQLATGTSGSGPIVAGIISLLNDYLISQGQPPLGFLNPWLYGGGLAGLNDITSGRNPGCGTDGFPAIVGWDPVTGLGTPDFMKLGDIIDERE